MAQTIVTDQQAVTLPETNPYKLTGSASPRAAEQIALLSKQYQQQHPVTTSLGNAKGLLNPYITSGPQSPTARLQINQLAQQYAKENPMPSPNSPIYRAIASAQARGEDIYEVIGSGELYSVTKGAKPSFPIPENISNISPEQAGITSVNNVINKQNALMGTIGSVGLTTSAIENQIRQKNAFLEKNVPYYSNVEDYLGKRVKEGYNIANYIIGKPLETTEKGIEKAGQTISKYQGYIPQITSLLKNKDIDTLYKATGLPYMDVGQGISTAAKYGIPTNIPEVVELALINYGIEKGITKAKELEFPIKLTNELKQGEFLRLGDNELKISGKIPDDFDLFNKIVPKDYIPKPIDFEKPIIKVVPRTDFGGEPKPPVIIPIEPFKPIIPIEPNLPKVPITEIPIELIEPSQIGLERFYAPKEMDLIHEPELVVDVKKLQGIKIADLEPRTIFRVDTYTGEPFFEVKLPKPPIQLANLERGTLFKVDTYKGEKAFEIKIPKDLLEFYGKANKAFKEYGLEETEKFAVKGLKKVKSFKEPTYNIEDLKETRPSKLAYDKISALNDLDRVSGKLTTLNKFERNLGEIRHIKLETPKDLEATSLGLKRFREIQSLESFKKGLKEPKEPIFEIINPKKNVPKRVQPFKEIFEEKELKGNEQGLIQLRKLEEPKLEEIPTGTKNVYKDLFITLGENRFGGTSPEGRIKLGETGRYKSLGVLGRFEDMEDRIDRNSKESSSSIKGREKDLSSEIKGREKDLSSEQAASKLLTSEQAASKQLIKQLNRLETEQEQRQEQSPALILRLNQLQKQEQKEKELLKLEFEFENLKGSDFNYPFGYNKSKKRKGYTRPAKSKRNIYFEPSFTAQELGITKRIKTKDLEKEFYKTRIGGLNFIPKLYRNG